MIVCPLCEHAQAAGTECEVCGRLAPSAADDATIPALEALEPTRLPPDRAAGPIAPLQDLEPTGVGADAAVAAAVAGPALELEPARAAPVDVVVEPLSGLEPNGEGIPVAARTPVPAVPVCRYCRTPAAPGERRCARCGMGLPRLAPARVAPPEIAPEDVRRCSCGAPVAGALCPACGARTPDVLDG